MMIANASLVKTADLVKLFQISGYSLLAWSLPEAYFSPVANGCVRFCEHFISNRTSYVRKIESLVGSRPLSVKPSVIFRSYLANLMLEKLFLLRCHRPDGWNPDVSIKGRENIDRALAKGRGAILWVVPFTFGDLVTKIAVHRSGVEVSHLSRFSHPFSGTLVGRSLLNPIRTSIELQFLAERLVMNRKGMIGSVSSREALSDRLKKNKVVSITVGMAGKRRITVPFLDSQICLATGPAFLSLQTSAPILPTFTLRHSSGVFSTTVESELLADQNKRLDARIEEMLIDFAVRLETYLLKWPDQFPWRRFAWFEKEESL